MASANFYNNKSIMIGVDLHHAQLLPTGISELATGHRVDDWPYVVMVSHSWVGGDDAKRTPMLTADGVKMIRDGFVIGKVPHIPVPMAYHPYEFVEQAKIVKDSRSTPLLKMKSVTSAGDPLSVCSIDCVGANVNCQDGGMKLTGVVLAPCSVKTAPQLKDLIFRIFDDFFKKWLVQKIIDIIDALLRKRFPFIPKAISKWILKKLVPKLVDWMEDLSKWLWDQIARKIDEPRKLEPKKEEPKEEEPKQEDPIKRKEREEREKQTKKWKEQERRERWLKDKEKYWPKKGHVDNPPLITDDPPFWYP